jgi:hypothetical protein
MTTTIVTTTAKKERAGLRVEKGVGSQYKTLTPVDPPPGDGWYRIS